MKEMKALSLESPLMYVSRVILTFLIIAASH
jgi:hypothetical protein